MSESSQAQVIERVQALLRKAESTEFPEEAEALLGKAQELITRHAIAEDELADPTGLPTVSHEEVPLGGSYTYERAMIWGAVAHANRCRVVSHRVYGSRKVERIALIGRPTDREIAKLLAASLEAQALRRLPAAQEYDLRGDLVRRRRSYLLGFAGEVSRRLTTVAESVEKETAPVGNTLAHADELDAYMQTLGKIRADRSQTSLDRGAFDEGSAAANRADLGQARLRRQRQLPA